MKKLLIITPHLSTGGAPQVTVNKVELLKDHFEIKVVEYAFLAWQFVVQRNKIINMLTEGVNFHSLGEDKFTELVHIMCSFSPDVVVMEEFPEMFMMTSSQHLFTHLQELGRYQRLHMIVHSILNIRNGCLIFLCL